MGNTNPVHLPVQVSVVRLTGLEVSEGSLDTQVKDGLIILFRNPESRIRDNNFNCLTGVDDKNAALILVPAVRQSVPGLSDSR